MNEQRQATSANTDGQAECFALGARYFFVPETSQPAPLAHDERHNQTSPGSALATSDMLDTN